MIDEERASTASSIIDHPSSFRKGVRLAEFASVTRNDALLDVIAAEVRACGPIPFRRFMELALYHPTLGYYRAGKRRIGERGDYITSPYVSPLFGAIVGRQVAEMWERLGTPREFHLVEMGAGDGRLMRDILEWSTRADPALIDVASPVFVEPDPALQQEQRRVLAHLQVRPHWVQDLSGFENNELIACFI
jgi:SAM-dependent MidA family methyltransferase